MPALNLTVNAKLVDALVPDVPFSGRREYVEGNGFEYTQATGGGPAVLPVPNLSSINALIIQTDKQVTVAMGSIVLNPGGIIVVFDGTPATTPPTIDNASGSTARIRGVALGQ